MIRQLFIAIGLVASIAHAKNLNGLPLPPPSAPRSHNSTVIGWGQAMPTAPKGLKVSVFAKGLQNPRWIYVGPNGDVFIAEADGPEAGGANRISLFRDGVRHVFATHLSSPFGMLINNGFFYVANTDAVVRFPYKVGDLVVGSAPTTLARLPSGAGHWTRNIALAPDGKHLFVTVGSASNVAESGIAAEANRANILEMDLDGKNIRVYASGLRNPNGLAYAPGSGALWTTVNERDNLGDNLVPDYMTAVREGAFYGWPYSYYGRYVDTRVKPARPDLVSTAVVPDVALGSHTASLGLAFGKIGAYSGAFIGQHGSWNHSTLTGYRVAYVPFDAKGTPTDPPSEFLGGFIANAKKYEVRGRPVGVAFAKDGSLLVADDVSGIVWRVSE